MASTYVNNLRLEEIGTGEQSGTWGDTTNTNLELIGQATAWGTRAIANASTDNITIADGAADADRCLGLKLTGGGQACTVTLLPNTSSKTWFMYNATSYTLTFTCGSGANVAIPAGQTKVIATDGLGSGGVVHDLLTAVNLAGTTVVDDLTVSDDLTVTDDMTVGGTLGVTGVLTATSLDISGDIDVDGTTNLDAVDIDGAVQLDSTLTVGVDDTGYDVKFFGATSGRYMEFDASEDRLFLRDNTKLVFGNGTDFEIYSGGTGAKLHANNGVLELEGDSVQIWNAGANEAQAKFTADGQVQLYFNGVEKFNTQDAGVVIHGTIANEGATDFTIDVSQDLCFDSGHGDFYFKDAGSTFLNLYESSDDLYLLNPRGDGDIIFQGIDGSSGVTALTLDMSDAGTAKFNSKIVTGLGSGYATDADITLGSANPAIFFHDTTSGAVNAAISVNSGIITFSNNSTGGNLSDQTARMTIGRYGHVEIIDGDLKFANGHGIDFSATSNSGGSTTSEILADYEDGTWTPAIKDLGGNAATMATANGKYVKVGNLVEATFSCTISSKGSMTGSYLFVTGIPYNHTGSNAGTAMINRFANLATACSSMNMELGGGIGSAAWFTRVTGTSQTQDGYLAPSEINSNWFVQGTMVYSVI